MRLLSQSVAKVGKMLRLHASQQVPPSHARPSFSFMSLCAASSKMYAMLAVPASAGCMHVKFVEIFSRVSTCRRSASKMWCSIRGTC